MKENISSVEAFIAQTLTGEISWNILIIDGPAASGKSTLGAYIANRCQATLIHMDDFYLPGPKRTPERLAEIGGNVDYERFYLEVILPIQAEAFPFSYRKFDCHEMNFTENFTINRLPVVIEGSYSAHPYFQNWQDIFIFLTLDQEIQMKRIISREGQEKAEVFRNRWIPRENHYFKHFAIAERADYTMSI